MPNLQQEAAVSAGYLRDMIRAYGVDVRYYKLKCPYPEVFKPILDLNNLTMHAYGYDPTPEYDVETPLIVYWKYEDNSLVLNAYGVQPNRVAKCWIDATDFAIAFAKKLAEYKEYKVNAEDEIELEFDGLQDFMENIGHLNLDFRSDLFNGECSPEFTEKQVKYLCEVIGARVGRGESTFSDIDLPFDDSSEYQESSGEESSSGGEQPEKEIKCAVPCRVKKIDDSYLATPHVVPELWKGMKYEDFINDTFDPYIKLHLDSVIFPRAEGSFKIKCHYEGAIIFYDLNKVSKYLQFIKPDVGDVISLPVYNHGDSVSRFEIIQVVDENNEEYMNPFLRHYIYECDLRNYVSSGEKVPEGRMAEDKYRKLNELINFANSEAGRKMSLYKDHEEDIYGGYDKLSGLDGAVLASNEEKGIKGVNGFKEKEGEGTPPEKLTEEGLLDEEVTLTVLADLVFPKPLSVVLATNNTEDWSRILLMNKSDSIDRLPPDEPWQHWLRCSDDTLVLRKDNRVYRLATILEQCELYSGEPDATIKPRRLKRNVYAQRGGFNDQPFNLVDSEESQLDLGQYSETLTGPKAGEEYKGEQIKNSGLSRLIWRNTRSYMDVKLCKDKKTGLEYYQLAVKLAGDKRKRRFPIATIKA